MICAFPPPELQTSADYRRVMTFLEGLWDDFFSSVSTVFPGDARRNMQCNANGPLYPPSIRFSRAPAGVCGDGGSMAFPAPVWKHGVGDVAKESACGKCVCAARSNPGGSASAARVRAAGCVGGGRGAGHSGGHPSRASVPAAEWVRGAGADEARVSERGTEPPGAGRLDSPDGNARPGERGGGRLGVSARGGACRPGGAKGLQAAGWAWRFKRSRCSAATWDWAGSKAKKAVQVSLNGLAAKRMVLRRQDQVASLFAISALVVASVAAARLSSAASTSCQAALLAFL